MTSLSKGENRKELLMNYRRQEEHISWLSCIYKDLRNMKGARKKKEKVLQEMLADPYKFPQLGKPPQLGIPLLLDPHYTITGVNFGKLFNEKIMMSFDQFFISLEKSKIFSSSLEPLGIDFITSEGIDYPV